MSWDNLGLVLLVIYLNTVVARLAYECGKDVGSKTERNLNKDLLKVGTIWRVGDDGRLYEVVSE